MVPPKITLAAPETVPLDKLEIHEDNVRKAAEAKGAIEDLAADIAARGLLQSLSVRPLLDADGQETGRYGVQAGGRRYLALKHLVKQKKLAKNAPIPCIAKSEGFAEADSLAENTQRQALTPLDEFRAFKALADKGQGEETIAAAFRVSTLVVRQRLRLANASPVILKAYEDDELSLEQLYAYCLTDNHARQEQVFEALSSYWNKGPDQIRRLLTEKAIPADDKRVHFIGIDAYLAAGGSIERDLFSDEDEGYLIDPDLVNRLAGEKLSLEAKKIRAEGWAWVEAAADFAWNHRRDFRAITPISPALSGEEQDEYETLAHEFESVPEADRAPEDSERVAAIEARLAGLSAKQAVYSDEQKAKAGAFVSLNPGGTLLAERGYRRYADILADANSQAASLGHGHDPDGGDNGMLHKNGEATGAASVHGAAASDEEESAELPGKLLTELTAYHSLGLRNALAATHDVAYLAVLHALTLKLFYRDSPDSCLQIEAQDALVPAFPGLGEFKAAQDIAARHAAFEQRLPENAAALWDALLALDAATQQALFAHCAGLTVNALHEAFGRPNQRRHAFQLAEALALDMGAQGFAATAANYLSRITKQQILQTVAEAKGQQTAELLAGHKKMEMAAEAERLLAGTGWLPEVLCTPVSLAGGGNEAAPLPAFLDDGEGRLQAAE